MDRNKPEKLLPDFRGNLQLRVDFDVTFVTARDLATLDEHLLPTQALHSPLPDSNRLLTQTRVRLVCSSVAHLILASNCFLDPSSLAFLLVLLDPFASIAETFVFFLRKVLDCIEPEARREVVEIY